MKRLRWPLIITIVCLPVALLAYGVHMPGLTPTTYAAPMSVPTGDQEIAWFNTTTSGANWERFVSGVHRASLLTPGMTVDDEAAFLDQTTAVPEVVIGMEGRAGKLRIRWYKLSSDHRPTFWMKLLAQRDPAPLAIIGGGSSDRALEMAWALARQTEWNGDRPLFLITNATAEKVHSGASETGVREDGDGVDSDLLQIYPNRSFRFCFNNRQMAEAMLDFVWQSPNLRPQSFAGVAMQAVGSGLLSTYALQHKPNICYVDWDDDPYSSDLIGQCRDALPKVLQAYRPPGWPPVTASISGWQVPFSVGGFTTPNRAEEEAADSMIKELRRLPPQRSLLIVPTVPSPARRFLRVLAASSPTIGRELVAINGDGMGVNTILRDGEFAWPIRGMPIPLVLFTHNNPIGWDEANPTRTIPAAAALTPPSSTEDVLHFAEIVRTLSAAAFAKPGETLGSSADDIASHFRDPATGFFDASGNRKGSTGEYVMVLKPLIEPDEIGIGMPEARVEVWRKTRGGEWELVRAWMLDQTRRPVGRANG